ncbi:hypothetical protein [Metabacillus halosaccharovorans]|uniref:hypothetical protein n=1 Tax=Metabacillus halosaccharovorans TaxID=930124 RepID=UPI000994D54E|nr:hypothetical protein [Metabacillus halosaccharovorans]
MKKCLYLLIVLFGLTSTGCSKGMLGDKPPEVYIDIGNEKYETKLGAYCWKGTCVDTAGPIELLKGKEPIKVIPGEKISFIMEYEPKPNEFHLIQMNENNENDIIVKENSFSAPTQKGIYYYSYGVWWMDEKEENLSNGDAFYALVLEVK